MVNFENGVTPINDVNLNKMQTDIINNDIPTKIITGQEVATNEYLDGKQVYMKRFYFDNLGDATTTSIKTGLILNNITVFKLEGWIKSTSANKIFPLTSGVNASSYYDALLYLDFSDNKIKITTFQDSFKNGFAYANLYYTKNDE